MPKNKGRQTTYKARSKDSTADPPKSADTLRLSADEVIRVSTRSREYALALLPFAIQAIAETTRSRNDRLRLSAAVELCKISGLLKSGGLQDTTAMAEDNEERKRYTTGGIILEHMLNMSETFRMPLSPRFVEDVRTFHDRVEKLVSEVGIDEEAPTLTIAKYNLPKIDKKRCQGGVRPASPSSPAKNAATLGMDGDSVSVET